MNKVQVLFFFLLFVSSICLNGQVMPPNINCVSNDTIFYEPVINSCGSFISYEVFTSNNENGPYSLLETVTDGSANFLVHPNSSSQPAFYYIIPNFNCPGIPVVNSDTISNRPPAVAILQTVSVENNELVLTWDFSPSPETELYNVFLLTDSGLEFLIETPDNTFTDILRDPSVSEYSYLLVAIDACGNRSIFGDAVTSVFLTTSIVPCENEINFVWNKHTNAQVQELWAITTSGIEIFIEALPVDSENFVLTNIPNIDFSGFFIRGLINGEQDKIANSNITDVNNEVTVMMDEIQFSKVSTQNENVVNLEWCWNKDADLSTYEIQYASPSITNSQIESVFTSLNASETSQISTNNTSTEVNTISIATTDECDGVFNSAEIETSLLSVAPLSESELEIKWNAYNYPNALLTQYELHEIKNGIDEIIYEGTNNQLNYLRLEGAGETCYYVITSAEGMLNNGDIKELIIQSNTACSNGFPIIRMPNAFNPYGINSIFKPLIGNPDAIMSYQMKIFSRYGELIFSSDSFDNGWNGRDGLREMPQGVYSYLVEIEILGGENVNLKGSVMLIR